MVGAVKPVGYVGQHGSGPRLDLTGTRREPRPHAVFLIFIERLVFQGDAINEYRSESGSAMQTFPPNGIARALPERSPKASKVFDPFVFIIPECNRDCGVNLDRSN